MKLLQQCFLFFIVVVILGHNLGNSQVSVYRTVGPTLVYCILKFFLLSNVSFQSKEEIHFPACTKEVRIFSSLVEPWGRSDNVPDTENQIY